jgi:hypothetical protein
VTASARLMGNWVIFVLNVSGGVSLLTEHFTVGVVLIGSRWNTLFFLSVSICVGGVFWFFWCRALVSGIALLCDALIALCENCYRKLLGILPMRTNPSHLLHVMRSPSMRLHIFFVLHLWRFEGDGGRMHHSGMTSPWPLCHKYRVTVWFLWFIAKVCDFYLRSIRCADHVIYIIGQLFPGGICCCGKFKSYPGWKLFREEVLVCVQGSLPLFFTCLCPSF